MIAPAWFEEALDEAREKVASGAMTRAEAEEMITAAAARAGANIAMLRLLAIADADFDANPGKPAPPQIASQLRRRLPPPPPAREQAA